LLLRHSRLLPSRRSSCGLRLPCRLLRHGRLLPGLLWRLLLLLHNRGRLPSSVLLARLPSGRICCFISRQLCILWLHSLLPQVDLHHIALLAAFDPWVGSTLWRWRVALGLCSCGWRRRLFALQRQGPAGKHTSTQQDWGGGGGDQPQPTPGY
jgi:hypothetical protein